MASNTLIKRANSEDEFDIDKMIELERCANDVIYFMRKYVKIQHPTKGVVSFDLFEYQEEMIDLIHNNKDSLLLCSRQLGKTISAAIYILWFATFHKAKLCVIASKNMSHATEIMSRIKFSYEELPRWLKAGCKFYNRTSIEFDNGSVIKSEATTEKTGRGGSPSILMLDEISFISHRIQQALWNSIAPSLSTGGKLIMTTTPNGDQDLFATLWRGSMSGTNSFKHIKILYDRHPDRGPESGYYEEMLGKIGELACRVELSCEFLSSDALLVNTLRLNELRHQNPQFEDNGFKFWEPLYQAPMYLVGADIATGTGNDFSVIQVFDFPALNQIAEYRSNALHIPELYEKLKWIINKLSAPVSKRRCEVMWTFERNSIGEAISSLYTVDEHPPEFGDLVNDVPGKIGMNTSNKSKVLACLQLKSLIEKIKNGLNIRSEIDIFELKNFISTGAGYSGKSGCTDDTVSALLLIVRLIKYIAEFSPEAAKIMYQYNADDYEQDLEMTDEPIAILI